MSNIVPITIIDDFFEEPDLVRDYALSLDYFIDENSTTPGVRSKQLHEINLDLFETTLKKFISIFYPNTQHIQWDAKMCFQLVRENFDEGWVHKDDSLISGMIYLNPHPEHDGGTTIYKRKYSHSNLKNLEEKKETFNIGNSGEKIPQNLVEKRKSNNDQFRETVVVKNEYNRLIAFDSNEFHSANKFFGRTKEQTRLTLLFFIYQIQCSDVIHYPISRTKFH